MARPLPEKVTIRLGPLAAALAKRLAKTGETQSEYVRRVVATDLGVEPPAMPEGNPQIRKLHKRNRKG